MIKEFSDHLAHVIAVQTEDFASEEVTSYGIECLANELISDLILIAAGILLHQLVSVMVWLVTFTMVRIQIGGFHASTHARCIFIGSIIGILCIFLNSFWVEYSLFYSLLVFLFSLYTAGRYAPVVHPNHPVSAPLRRKAHFKALFFISVEGIAFFVLRALNWKPCGAIPSALLAAAGMCMLQVCLNRKNQKPTHS